MLSEKAIQGLLNASPEKRYKSFLSTVTDLQEIWLLLSKEGYATLDLDGVVHVLVWPRKEICLLYRTGSEEAVSMEVHSFIERCKKLEEDIRFMVFPTEKDTFIVTVQQMCEDLVNHLEELE